MNERIKGRMNEWMNEWMIKPWDKNRFEIRTKHCINDLTAKIFKQSDRLADIQFDITNQIFLQSPPPLPMLSELNDRGWIQPLPVG